MAEIHPELTFNVAQNNNIAVFATLCGIIFIFQILFTSVPFSILSIWALIMIILCLFRFFIGLRLLKCTEANSEWEKNLSSVYFKRQSWGLWVRFYSRYG